MQRALMTGVIGMTSLVLGACVQAGAPAGDGAEYTNQASTEPNDQYSNKGLTRQQANWLRSTRSAPAGR